MGRDIHVRIVKLDRKTNKWKSICLYHRDPRTNELVPISPYDGIRNYELFDILNGKNNDGFPVVSMNLKALPLSLAKSIKRKSKIVGYYGFAEVNLADAEVYLHNNPKIRDYDYDAADDEDWDENAWQDNPVKYFLKRVRNYIDFAEPYWNFDPDSDIRILYWFDC